MIARQVIQTIPVWGALMLGCGTPIFPAMGQTVVLPENETAVITAQNKFAFRLFREALREDGSTSNKLVSPLSIYLDLSMAYNGAAGNTREAIQRALQLEETDIGVLNRTNQSLTKGLLNEDPSIMLNIANSIWHSDRGFQPLASFLKTNSTYYRAKVVGADFDSPATVNRINDWVASQTHQQIKKIVDQVDSSDIMCLINAVYFKGKWKYNFDSTQTRDRPFYKPGNNVIRVPFMVKERAFNYAGLDSLQLIEVPYGKGDFNMYILLPAKGLSLHQFIGSIDEDHLQQYISALSSTKVRLFLPKWKYSYKIDNLKPELRNMGMGPAFSRQADFSNMYNSDAEARISQVAHKASIEVNEQGTEAAAATATMVVIGYTGVKPATPVLMDVNRPFLYLITEKNSGAILFIGEVNDPALGDKE